MVPVLFHMSANSPFPSWHNSWLASSLIVTSATLGTTDPLLQIHNKQTFPQLPAPWGDTEVLWIVLWTFVSSWLNITCSPFPYFPPSFYIHVWTQKGSEGVEVWRWNNGLAREEVILLHLTPQRTLLINWLFNCVWAFIDSALASLISLGTVLWRTVK